MERRREHRVFFLIKVVSVKKVQIGSKLTMSSRHSKFITLKTIAFAFNFL